MSHSKYRKHSNNYKRNRSPVKIHNKKPMNRTENRTDNFCEGCISKTYRWKQEPFSIIKFVNDFNDDLFTIYFANLVSFPFQRE